MAEEEKKVVEDSKELIKELNNHKDKDFIGRLYYKNKPIEKTLEILLNLIDRLLKKNEKLENDISNMYDEEVVISIMYDEFNLSRSEALELLGGE